MNDELDQKLKSAMIDPFDYEEIEDKSLKMTNNFNSETYSSSLLKSSWNPSGFIRVWDDVLLRTIPVEGAKVRVKNWFKIREKFTDSDGYFITGSFDNRVDYSIKWEMDHYDIRNGGLVQAYYQGPNESNSAWNLDIYEGGESIMYATIQRAAFKSFYGDNLGMYRPFLTGFKTKIAYKNTEADYLGMCFCDLTIQSVIPDIYIHGIYHGNPISTVNIFRTTAHELGHQSHILIMGIWGFITMDKVIRESWARAVGWALTNNEYSNLGNRFNNQRALDFVAVPYMQNWTKNSTNWEYSPIFIDLIDNFNQRNGGMSGNIFYAGDITTPNDNITGYTMQFIYNNILGSSFGLGSLNTALKANKIIGVTDENIDELFAQYW